MSRGKVTVAERIEAAKACAEGRISQTEAAHRLGVDRTSMNNIIWQHNKTLKLRKDTKQPYAI